MHIKRTAKIWYSPGRLLKPAIDLSNTILKQFFLGELGETLESLVEIFSKTGCSCSILTGSATICEVSGKAGKDSGLTNKLNQKIKSSKPKKIIKSKKIALKYLLDKIFLFTQATDKILELVREISKRILFEKLCRQFIKKIIVTSYNTQNTENIFSTFFTFIFC